MSTRKRYAAALALVAALSVATVAAVSPVSAADPSEPLALQHARAEMAYCQRLADIAADGTSRDTRAKTCVKDARAVVDSYATPSPTASPTVSPTSSPSPSPTPSPTASPTPTPAPTGCALPLYPTAACTGVPAGWAPTRTINGSYTTRADGEVIDGWRVTGSIDVRHQNVVVRNSEVYGRIYNQLAGVAFNGLLIEDVTVGPPSGNSGETNGAIGVCGYTARRVHIRNSPEGFRVGGYGHSGGKCAPVTIEDSYVKLMNVGCDHSDGVSELDWRPNSTVIRHNTIDMRGVSCATSPLYIGFGGPVTDNLLMGGAYVLRIYVWHSQANYTVTGNRIVDATWDSGTGPALVESCSIVDIWRDNWVVRLVDGHMTLLRLLSNCTETAYASGSVFA